MWTAPARDTAARIAWVTGTGEVRHVGEPPAGVLAPASGVSVHREHGVQIAQKVAGDSLGSPDLLRKAMGK